MTPDQAYQMAIQALSKGSLQDAQRFCAIAIEARPDKFPVVLLHAEILMMTGQYDRALTAYERASSLNPGHALPFTRGAIIAFRKVFGRPPTPSQPQ